MAQYAGGFHIASDRDTFRIKFVDTMTGDAVAEVALPLRAAKELVDSLNRIMDSIPAVEK